MRVVVIGAGGQLGSEILKLTPEGVKVIGLTHEDIEIADLQNVKRVLHDLKPEVVINTAAFHKTDSCEEFPLRAFEVNSAGVKNLVDVCRKFGSVLLHISTDYVFDGKKAELREPYTEEDTPNPINVYGISKYAGELMVRNYLREHYIVRVASLYGKKGSKSKGGNFVLNILKKAKEGEDLRIVDDVFMSPTYTVDAAKEIWNLVLKRRPFGTYHITNGGYCSWYEFALEIFRLADVKARVKPVSSSEFPRKAQIPRWTPLISVKGIRLRHWKEALREFLTKFTP